MSTSSPKKLETTIKVVLALIGREVGHRIKKGNLEPLDLSHWIDRMSKVVVPILQEYYRVGMDSTAVRLGVDAISTVVDQRSAMDLVRDRAVEDGSLRTYTVPAVAKRISSNSQVLKAVGRSVNAILHKNRSPAGFNPKVIDAINQASINLCRETLDTAATDANSAIDEVKEALKRHSRYATRYGPEEERGKYKHVLASLSDAVSKVFNDPYRAYRIANTEYPRAVNTGAILEAREAPFKTKKVWKSAAGSCKRCVKLNDRERKLDQPFTTVEDAGPYAVVMCPPLHPNCECKMLIKKA